MGLFRRAGKILKRGTGMRDCCCRPEQPEECFCLADWCRYYWEITGNSNGIDFVEGSPPECVNLFGHQQNYNSLLDVDPRPSCYVDAPDSEVPFGLLQPIQFEFDGNVFIGRMDFTGKQRAFTQGRTTYIAESDFYHVGPLSQEAVREYFIGGDGPIIEPSVCFTGAYSGDASVRLQCGVQTGSRLIATARLDARLDATNSGKCRSQSTPWPSYVPIYGRYLSVDIDLSPYTSCQRNPNWLSYDDGSEDVRRIHLDEDLVFEFSASGVTLNGTFHAFSPYVPPGGPSYNPVIDNLIESGRTSIFPDYTPTFTLKRKSTCRTGACDCTSVLTGRTVVFEGQTFTYGSGQTFNSGDGLTVWEESPTGTFRKIIYDDCDPGQQIKTFEETAQVFCTNIDGTDFWAVQLVVQCLERDACSPPFDRSRTVTWDGILACDSDGYPLGSPETELASNIPSSPAPTGTCDPTPEMPSFSFS